jgi:hypothetical protein
MMISYHFQITLNATGIGATNQTPFARVGFDSTRSGIGALRFAPPARQSARPHLRSAGQQIRRDLECAPFGRGCRRVSQSRSGGSKRPRNGGVATGPHRAGLANRAENSGSYAERCAVAARAATSARRCGDTCGGACERRAVAAAPAASGARCNSACGRTTALTRRCKQLDRIADSGPSRTVVPTHRGQRSGDCGQLLMSVRQPSRRHPNQQIGSPCQRTTGAIDGREENVDEEDP